MFGRCCDQIVHYFETIECLSETASESRTFVHIQDCFGLSVCRFFEVKQEVDVQDQFHIPLLFI